MIIVRLMGGLGNQMFQYAAARRLSLIKGYDLKLDLTFIQNNKKYQRLYGLHHFNIAENIASGKEISSFVLPRFKNKYLYHFINLFYKEHNTLIQDVNSAVDEKIFHPKEKAYIIGYWQSYKYFEDIREILLNEFTLRDIQSLVVNPYYQMITRSNSIAIHIRRGDFINHPFHNVCGMDYYKKAIEYMNAQIADSNIFVFSDDIEWCKKELYSYPRLEFVDDELLIDNPHYSLVLMSLCKNIIISNSSFSWWAAWLNSAPNKIVVSPSKWYLNNSVNTDYLIPSDWIKIQI